MRPLIVANWKANPSTLAEAKKLFASIKKGAARKNKTEVVICPPFVFLPILSKIAGQKIKIGAQDAFWREGAFTGEVSAKMLKSVGCKYVIIGHSEQRAFGETDETINQKLKAVISAKLSPILCIGESEEEKKEEKTKKVLEKQLTLDLKDISKFKIQSSKFVVAYEPIWAIGTGKSCDFDTTMSMNLLIRKILADIYNRRTAQKARILYGGSVTAKNSFGYVREAKMDGLLIGGASLRAKEFIAILRKF